MTYASAATAPFYHGTRADLAPGDPLSPGHTSNYADRKLSQITFSGTPDAAIRGRELAKAWLAIRRRRAYPPLPMTRHELFTTARMPAFD